MNKNGFSRYDAVLNIEYDAPKIRGKKKEVKSPQDVILDQIFSLDENGWPRTSISMLLSNKTSDDIRKYIEDNILVAKSQGHVINDENVIAEFGKLDSEFIAYASRNRHETVEQYEARISDYVAKQSEESARNQRIERYKKFWDDQKKKLNGE